MTAKKGDGRMMRVRSGGPVRTNANVVVDEEDEEGQREAERTMAGRRQVTSLREEVRSPAAPAPPVSQAAWLAQCEER